MKQNLSLPKYTWKTSKYELVIMAFTILFAIGYSFFDPQWNNELWSDWLDPFIAYATVGVAILIWISTKYNQMKSEREQQLPKRLHVTYLHGEETWHVKNAPLAGEADIRAWGQSIGKEVFNHGKFYEFAGFQILDREVNNDRIDYHVNIYLRAPMKEKKLRQVQYNKEGILMREFQQEKQPAKQLKLDVTYEYLDQQWKVHNAPLANESDIRVWGQSLGREPFNEGQFFHLSGFHIEKPKHEPEKTTHHILFFLAQPLSNTTTREIRYDDTGKLIVKPKSSKNE